jgi:hypothetical protein
VNCFGLDGNESFASDEGIDGGEPRHCAEQSATFRNHLGRQSCAGCSWCPFVSLGPLLVTRLSHDWEPGGSLGAEHLWKYMGVQSIELSLLIAGSLFVMMRSIDFAIGGPTFRLFVVSKRRLNSIAAELCAHHH